MEQDKTFRLTSATIHKRHPTPVILNRELACLKHMFTFACKGLLVLPGGVPKENPVTSVEILDE